MTDGREQHQSVPLWQRARCTLYLRLAAIVASCFTIIAAAIALNVARNHAEEGKNQLADGEQWTDGATEDIVRETLAVTGVLTAAAAATLLLQTALVVVTKCSAYVCEPPPATPFYLKIADFMISFVLVAALAASTTAEGVVAYGWAEYSDKSNHERVFKAVAGSTVFGALSVVVLSGLCIITFNTVHSLSRSHKVQQSNIATV